MYRVILMRAALLLACMKLRQQAMEICDHTRGTQNYAEYLVAPHILSSKYKTENRKGEVK